MSCFASSYSRFHRLISMHPLSRYTALQIFIFFCFVSFCCVLKKEKKANRSHSKSKIDFPPPLLCNTTIASKLSSHLITPFQNSSSVETVSFTLLSKGLLFKRPIGGIHCINITLHTSQYGSNLASAAEDQVLQQPPRQ